MKIIPTCCHRNKSYIYIYIYIYTDVYIGMERQNVLVLVLNVTGSQCLYSFGINIRSPIIAICCFSSTRTPGDTYVRVVLQCTTNGAYTSSAFGEIAALKSHWCIHANICTTESW